MAPYNFNRLLCYHIRWHSSIAFISLLIDKIDQSGHRRSFFIVVPIYQHQLMNSRLHSRNSFIATSPPLLYTCASSQKLVSRSGRHPTATSWNTAYIRKNKKKSKLDWWWHNKYWDGPQLIFIDYTFIRHLLEALYNKLVPLVQCVHVRFWYVHNTLESRFK